MPQEKDDQRRDASAREGLEEAGHQRDVMGEKADAAPPRTRSGAGEEGAPGRGPHATGLEGDAGASGPADTTGLSDQDADVAPTMDRDAYHQSGGPADDLDASPVGRQGASGDDRRFVEAPPTEDATEPRGKDTNQ